MRFTPGQLTRLSELFIDLAKGSFLAAIATPAFFKEATLFEAMRSLGAGLFFTYLSLKAEELKEVNR